MSLGIDEISGVVIVLIAPIPMSSRLDLTDSMTELDVKVRSKNPCDALQNLLRRVSGNLLLRSFTIFELKKRGMASKKFAIPSSSPRLSIVQRKMSASMSDDRFDTVSSAAFFIPPK